MTAFSQQFKNWFKPSVLVHETGRHTEFKTETNLKLTHNAQKPKLNINK